MLLTFAIFLDIHICRLVGFDKLHQLHQVFCIQLLELFGKYMDIHLKKHSN